MGEDDLSIRAQTAPGTTCYSELSLSVSVRACDLEG